jgi:hypothetical protein
MPQPVPAHLVAVEEAVEAVVEAVAVEVAVGAAAGPTSAVPRSAEPMWAGPHLVAPRPLGLPRSAAERVPARKLGRRQ